MLGALESEGCKDLTSYLGCLVEWWSKLLQPKFEARFGADGLYKVAALQVFQGSFDAAGASAVMQQDLSDDDLGYIVATSVLSKVGQGSDGKCHGTSTALPVASSKLCDKVLYVAQNGYSAQQH
jgi:hypothetical protein